MTSSLAPAAAESCFCLSCLTGGFSSYQITSVAMEPSLPAGSCALFRHWDPSQTLPARGQIVTFTHPSLNQPFTFRIIAHPKDRIAVKEGQVILNGEPLAQERQGDFVAPLQIGQGGKGQRNCAEIEGLLCHAPLFTTTLPDGTKWQILDTDPAGPLDNYPETEIPEDMVFVMGDNRDNAADSRLSAEGIGVGLLPITRITGTFEAFLKRADVTVAGH